MIDKEKLSEIEKELLVMTLDDEKKLKEISEGNEKLEKVTKKIVTLSKEEGLRDGRKQGLEEGRKEGIKEGIRQTTINLLNQNVDINIISLVTGLTIEEINKLNS